MSEFVKILKTGDLTPIKDRDQRSIIVGQVMNSVDTELIMQVVHACPVESGITFDTVQQRLISDDVFAQCFFQTLINTPSVKQNFVSNLATSTETVSKLSLDSASVQKSLSMCIPSQSVVNTGYNLDISGVHANDQIKVENVSHKIEIPPITQVCILDNLYMKGGYWYSDIGWPIWLGIGIAVSLILLGIFFLFK